MRMLLIVLSIALLGTGVWVFTRDGGPAQQVSEDRVEGALLANGLSAPMAECMAEDLHGKLSVEQVQKLEQLGPQGGKSTLALSRKGAVERLRLVKDSEAVSALIGSATSCGVAMVSAHVPHRG